MRCALIATVASSGEALGCQEADLLFVMIHEKRVAHPKSLDADQSSLFAFSVK
jgi:hypothetical protein